jgi:hypothetical protein
MMNTPGQTVLAFIRAHSAWEAATNERAKPLRRGTSAYEAATEFASTEYDDLLARFCISSVNRQGISFGDDPMHRPEHESIDSVVIVGKNATVKTKNIGMHGFVSDYEYHLVDQSGEWRIGSLLYIDPDGKYECL